MRVSVLNKSVNDGENPICAEMFDVGVNWIPRTILDALVEKAVQLSKTTGVLVEQSRETTRSNVTRMREKQRQIEYKGVKS